MEWETVTTVPGGILTGMGGIRGDLTRTKIFKDTGVGIKRGGALLDMGIGKTSPEVEGRDFIIIDQVLEWVAREPEGHTTLEEAINRFYGLEDVQESPYIEDSYLMQDEEWEEEAWENDRFRFLEELREDNDFDRYQLTWSDEDDDIFHYYEDDEWEGEEIDLVSEEIKDNFFHMEGEGIPEMPNVDSEENLVSLQPEKELSRLVCPSRSRGGLELVFYNKHTLYPIIEEGTNWDKSDNGVENLELVTEASDINIQIGVTQEEDLLRECLEKGQELNNKQLVFGRLEQWERKEETLLGRTSQYENFPIQVMGQNGHLDGRSKRGEWFSSGKPGRKARVDWKYGKKYMVMWKYLIQEDPLLSESNW